MGRMGRRAPLASGEYEVEEIIGKYSRRGTIYYHVKWKGFPESENSWIPEKYLNCPRLLMKYERKAEREHEEINAKRIKLSE